jgi:hypothetical protein
VSKETLLSGKPSNCSFPIARIASDCERNTPVTDFISQFSFLICTPFALAHPSVEAVA